MATDSGVSDHRALHEEGKEEIHGVKAVVEQGVDTQLPEEVKDSSSPGVDKVVTSLTGEDKPKIEDLPCPSAVQLPVTEETCEQKKYEPFTNEEVKKADEVETPTTEVIVVDKETELPAVEEEEKKTEPVKIEEVKKLEEEETPTTEVMALDNDTKVPAVEAEEKKTEPVKVEEVKKTDEEEKPTTEVSVHKETELEEKLKGEDLTSATAALAESEEKTKDKHAECPAIEEVEKVEKEPEVDNVAVAAPLAEPAEKIEDQKVEIPVQEEAKKTGLEEEPKDNSPPSEEMKAPETKDVESIVSKDCVQDVVPETAEKEKESIVTKDSDPEAVTKTAEKKEEKQEVVEDSVPKADAEIAEKYVDQQVDVKEAVPETVAEIGDKKEDDPIVAKHSVPEAADEIVEKKGEKPIVVDDSVPKEVAEIGEKKEEDPKVECAKEEPNVVEEEEKMEDFAVKIETVVAKEVPEEKSTATEEPINRDEEATGAAKVSNNMEDKEESVVTNRNGAENETKNEAADIVKKPAADPEKPKVESKGEEAADTDETATKEEKAVDETKSAESIPKEEEKSTPKQSNSIIGKVKKSFIKAKKAITGKNLNAKTPPQETKDDVKT